LQRAVDRDRGAFEERCSLGGGPADHVAKQEGGALPRRQQLNGGDKGARPLEP
jgi:hypothetical protein